MKDKTGCCQHGLTNKKSCLANVIAFYNEKNGFLDEGRIVDVDYLDLSKVFDTISCNIILDKLTKYRLDHMTMRWTENHLETGPRDCDRWPKVQLEASH